MALLPSFLEPGVDVRDAVPESRAREAMAAICATHALSPATLHACSRGSDLVFSVDERMIIKLTAPRWAAELDTEASFLEALDGALSVETPALVARGDLEGWPYVIMTRLPGEHLADIWPTLDHPARLELAAAIGELVAELHSTEVPGAPEPSWAAWVASQRERALEYHRKRAPSPAWLDAITAFLERVGDPYKGDDATVTLHTELLDAHMMVRSRAGRWRLSGLIDFADGMRGRASYEIAALVEFVFKGEEELMTTCLRHARWPRELDEPESERLFACALLHQFASLPRMMAAASMPADGPVDLAQLRRRLHGLAPAGR